MRSTQARDSDSSRRNMRRASFQGCLSRRKLLIGCGEDLRRLGGFDGRCRSATRFRSWARTTVPRTYSIRRAICGHSQSVPHVDADAAACIGIVASAGHGEEWWLVLKILPRLGEDACAKSHRGKGRETNVLCCIAVARKHCNINDPWLW